MRKTDTPKKDTALNMAPISKQGQYVTINKNYNTSLFKIMYILHIIFFSFVTDLVIRLLQRDNMFLTNYLNYYIR